MNKDPVVSIIMPMRNAEVYVAEAVDSILCQSFQDVELIIIDDQSTDQSREIVENILHNDHRIKLINGNAQGISAAKNKGVKLASGRFVMFCDADDLLAKDCIERQLSWLALHPDVGAVCAQFALMDSYGGNIVNLDSGKCSCDITEELLSGQTRTSLCTFIIKRELVDVIGGFREFFVSAEDIDFQFRLAEVCKIFYMSENVYFYRLNDSSIVHTQPSKKRIFFEETARLFRQQRALKGIDDLQSGHPPLVPEDQGDAINSKDQLQGALIGSAWRLHKQGEKLKAIKSGFRACLINPANLMAWKSYIMLFIK
ncbi:glycosyltransferase family A protein [Methylobacter sp. BBA5.1]|uniref:glycosyltransferase family 2 protein n=1 Tax=Methylobacter sp. BBA5.1 TaxID=1495064 RepID=UPI0009E09CD1|nr:glycosyltransferase family A protein [Methylobacter sp. BBA5.1]